MPVPAPPSRRAWPASVHLIFFALIVAVPLLLLLGIMLYRSAAFERAQFERRIVQVLEGLIDDIDRDIERQVTILQTLATSQSLATSDWRGFHDEATAGLRGKAYIVLIDADGRQLVNTFAPFGLAPPITGDLQTLQTIRQTGRPVVSGIFMSLVAKKPVYNVSIPILRGGELRFVMSIGLMPDDLQALLRGQKLEPEWTISVWDGKGMVLARSHDQARYLGRELAARLRDHPPATIFRTTDTDNVDVLAAVGHSAVAPWGITVTFPANVLERQLRQNLLLWGLTIVLVAGLVIGVALFYGRQFTRPLTALTAAARALGRGEPFDIPPSRLAEANAVNAALNTAQRELAAGSAALRRSEEQLRTAADAARFGAHEYDVANDRVTRSPQMRRILGVDESGGVSTFDAGLGYVHPDDRDRVGQDKRRILAEVEGAYQLEYRIRRGDGEVRWVMDRGQVVRDGSGRAQTVIGVLLDITDLKAAEQRQSLLFDELNHRVKNTLAIVQSLAQQTLRTQPTPREFSRAFGDRLGSLARAHDLLTRGSWQGASLKEIVATALAPFLDEGRAIEMSGDPVIVPANATVTLSLMLHELATNAAKYGALSVRDGRLEITWSGREEGATVAVTMHWRERGGPTVTPPARGGFGSRLLAASAQQLNGRFDIDYAAEGVRCVLVFAVPRPEASVGS